ncbi:lysophospholipid acyltransferase family protein [Gordonia sp. ABSL1-1]|uniref:lysophospholipid acyltransferase family protein n=1 Tax=Gordonia sp. ABSL1-1 TaxID=3053923 RepID=UPI0025726170|nr:lysophospholipid acyltransferase family protein [Gordonia sp. ABSL1-1]MDL9935616.1 lysophospholipid acyltransferase family protein [Gordonia sp. ABSL1-1]
MIRLVLTLSLVAVGLLAVVGLPRLVRRRFLRGAARFVLAAVGVAVAVEDRRPFAGNARGLIVANHVSFLDVLAIAAVAPAHFVAKAEVAAMPGIGAVARRFGVISVDRASLRRLPQSLDAAVAALHRDRCVAVFPEGTTRCGRSTGEFRPAFFQAAIDAGVPVLPMRVDFRVSGVRVSGPAFIGEDTIGETMTRILRMRRLTVVVRRHEVLLPDVDRRELAARCRLLIADHEVLGHEPDRDDRPTHGRVTETLPHAA